MPGNKNIEDCRKIPKSINRLQNDQYKFYQKDVKTCKFHQRITKKVNFRKNLWRKKNYQVYKRLPKKLFSLEDRKNTTMSKYDSSLDCKKMLKGLCIYNVILIVRLGLAHVIAKGRRDFSFDIFDPIKISLYL